MIVFKAYTPSYLNVHIFLDILQRSQRKKTINMLND